MFELSRKVMKECFYSHPKPLSLVNFELVPGGQMIRMLLCLLVGCCFSSVVGALLANGKLLRIGSS